MTRRQRSISIVSHECSTCLEEEAAHRRVAPSDLGHGGGTANQTRHGLRRQANHLVVRAVVVLLVVGIESELVLCRRLPRQADVCRPVGLYRLPWSIRIRRVVKSAECRIVVVVHRLLLEAPMSKR